MSALAPMTGINQAFGNVSYVPEAKVAAWRN
jgi:hypothetical protein